VGLIIHWRLPAVILSAAEDLAAGREADHHHWRLLAVILSAAKDLRR